MTAEDFIIEVHSSNIMPDEFDKKFEEFRAFQKIVWSTLDEFKRVCEKNDITYSLAFGSLLGVVRDKGQIPWDYDVDVYVPYNEKQRLVEALKKDLNENYFFVSPDNDPRCCRSIMRITPKGYNSNILHVDVFFFTGAPDNEEERMRLANRLTEIEKIRYAKLVNPFVACEGKLKWFILLCIRKLKVISVSTKKLLDEYDILCSKYDPSVTTYAINTSLLANKKVYLASGLYNTIPYEIGDSTYDIPLGYEDILKLEYGDYTKVLPLDRRLKEFVTSYDKLIRYACRK